MRPSDYLILSLNKGLYCNTPYTVVLIIGTPRKVPLILGNHHVLLEIGIAYMNPASGMILRLKSLLTISYL